jgi:plasmid stabilization system protein ParE
MEFALHPEAIEDLDDIHAYIDGFNPGAADRVLDEIFTAFDSLARLPRSPGDR